MAITRRKSKKVEAFIEAAPDARAEEKVPGSITRGNRQQISITLAPKILAILTEMAAETGQTRTGIISMALYKEVKEWQRLHGRDTND